MRLKVDLGEAHARWRKLAEQTSNLHAMAKELRDDDPRPAIAFVTKTGVLLSEITQAAVNDLENDADELEFLAYLRDPDVVSALTTAGSELSDRWLFIELRGGRLGRADVRALISASTKQLAALKRRTLKVLRSIEKLRGLEGRLAKPKKRSSKSTPNQSDEMASRFSNFERLGEGVYGEVWRADDQKLGRKVAIKFIRSTDADHLALAHARALARVQHPNIVTVYEVPMVKDPQTNKPAHAVVMELVEGPALDERLGRSMSGDEVMRIGNAILDAVSAYHAQGFAHLDVHDGNVIVGDSAIKIIDPLYFETAAFRSTSAREKQQGRDIRQARDLLVQMLYLGAVSIDIAQRFERETIHASAEQMRTKLREALGAVSPGSSTVRQDQKDRVTIVKQVGGFTPGPQADTARALLVRLASINKDGGRRVIRSIPHFSTETGVPLSEVRDAAALLEAHGYVKYLRDDKTIELTLLGRDEAHRLGVEVNAPMKDAMKLLRYVVDEKKQSRTGLFDHIQLCAALGLSLGALRDAAQRLQQMGLGKVSDNEDHDAPMVSFELSERGHEKGEQFLDDVHSMLKRAESPPVNGGAAS